LGECGVKRGGGEGVRGEKKNLLEGGRKEGWPTKREFARKVQGKGKAGSS